MILAISGLSSEYAYSGVDRYSNSSGVTLALMICGLSIIIIGVLVRLVGSMRFDRLAKQGLLGPDPEGYDPDSESRREFHLRTQAGVTTGLVLGGAMFILASLIVAFSGIAGSA